MFQSRSCPDTRESYRIFDGAERGLEVDGFCSPDNGSNLGTSLRVPNPTEAGTPVGIYGRNKSKNRIKFKPTETKLTGGTKPPGARVKSP